MKHLLPAAALLCCGYGVPALAAPMVQAARAVYGCVDPRATTALAIPDGRLRNRKWVEYVHRTGHCSLLPAGQPFEVLARQGPLLLLKSPGADGDTPPVYAQSSEMAEASSQVVPAPASALVPAPAQDAVRDRQAGEAAVASAPASDPSAVVGAPVANAQLAANIQPAVDAQAAPNNRNGADTRLPATLSPTPSTSDPSTTVAPGAATSAAVAPGAVSTQAAPIQAAPAQAAPVAMPPAATVPVVPAPATTAPIPPAVPPTAPVLSAEQPSATPAPVSAAPVTAPLGTPAPVRAPDAPHSSGVSLLLILVLLALLGLVGAAVAISRQQRRFAHVEDANWPPRDDHADPLSSPSPVAPPAPPEQSPQAFRRLCVETLEQGGWVIQPSFAAGANKEGAPDILGRRRDAVLAVRCLGGSATVTPEIIDEVAAMGQQARAHVIVLATAAPMTRRAHDEAMRLHVHVLGQDELGSLSA